MQKTGNSFSNGAKAVAITAVVLAVTGSAALSVASAEEARRSAAAQHSPEPVSGVWRMDGYGTVLAVAPGRVQEYRTTDSACLKGASGRRAGGNGAAARYVTVDGEGFTLRPARGSRDRASMTVDGSAGKRHLRRIEALPGACGHPLPEDPLTTFGVFWQTFEENYPFFAAKGVD